MSDDPTAPVTSGTRDVDTPASSMREVIHEAVTMALYVSLSLLAVLLATPTSVEESSPQLALTVFLTAVALVLAHQVAFRLSTRLLNRGLIDEGSLRLLVAQVIGGISVAALAALPVLLFGTDGLRVSAVLLIILVAVVGYITARSVPVGRLRAVLYVGVVVLAVGLVLAVKSLVGH